MVVSVFIKWNTTSAKWWHGRLINEGRDEKLRKLFLLQGTMSSLVPKRVETIEIPLGRNDRLLKLTSGSGVLQLCPAATQARQWWVQVSKLQPPSLGEQARAAPPPRAPATMPRRAHSDRAPRASVGRDRRPVWCPCVHTPEQGGHGAMEGGLLRPPQILHASKSSIGEWKPLEMENA
jgi:hypothetical protein